MNTSTSLTSELAPTSRILVKMNDMTPDARYEDTPMFDWLEMVQPKSKLGLVTAFLEFQGIPVKTHSYPADFLNVAHVVSEHWVNGSPKGNVSVRSLSRIHFENIT